MNPHTFVLMGQSGCGKGEQSKRLEKVIKEKSEKEEVFYFETGPNFREFVSGNTFSNKLSKEISDNGNLQPSFLAIYFWAEMLLKNLKGHEHIILDGICRRVLEAQVFSTAMEFYGRKPVVVYIKVSKEWARERLQKRGRMDDKNAEQLNGRLDWFEDYTIPAIEYFKSNENFTVLEVNGEQSIEEVQKEILEKLGW